MSEEKSDPLKSSKGNIYFYSWKAPDSIFYKYDTTNSDLVELPGRPTVEYSSPVLYDQSIYFTGGLVDPSCSNVYNRFNLKNESWDVLPLEYERYYHGACVIKDSLYIIGGCRELENLKTINVYDFETGTWLKGPDMVGTRKFFGTSLYNGSIYITGGITDISASSASAERLDPREGIWKKIPRLRHVSGACSSAVESDLIYCSGFRSGFTEKFETRFNEWEEIIDTFSVSARIVSTKGKIYRVSVEGIFHLEDCVNTWNNVKDVKCFTTEIGAVAD